MPGRQGLRPLKASWYIGVYGPELMLCAGALRIGWALVAPIENGWVRYAETRAEMAILIALAC
jgi:hypothetical protein